MRFLILLATLGVFVQSTSGSELVLVNKETGEEVGILKEGAEIELDGVTYVVTVGTQDTPVVNTPEGVLRAYFSCKHWEDRIPLVVDQDRVAKLMNEYYSTGILGFQAPRYVKIDPTFRKDPSNAEIYIVTVNVSGSEVDYVVRNTEDGYRVDWEKSSKGWSRALADEKKQADEREDELTKKRFDLEGAIFLVKLTKLGDNSTGDAVIRIDVENRSRAFLAQWTIEASVHDEDGNYLGQTSASGRNLRPGKRMFERLFFSNVRIVDIDSWFLKAKHFVVEDPSGEDEWGAEKYFTLREVKDKSGNANTKPGRMPESWEEIDSSKRRQQESKDAVKSKQFSDIGDEGNPLPIWKDRSGKYSVAAQFLAYEKGKVFLRKNNGEIVTLPITELSKEDQKRVREEVKKRKSR